MRSRALSAALAMILLLSPLLAGPAVSDECLPGGGDDLGGGVSGGASGGVSGGVSGGIAGGISGPASSAGGDFADAPHVISEWVTVVQCSSDDDDQWTSRGPWQRTILTIFVGQRWFVIGTLILP